MIPEAWPELEAVDEVGSQSIQAQALGQGAGLEDSVSHSRFNTHCARRFESMFSARLDLSQAEIGAASSSESLLFRFQHYRWQLKYGCRGGMREPPPEKIKQTVACNAAS